MSLNARILFLVYGSVALCLLREFNKEVVEPYMDEPFHVPQAQAYCRGEWSTWDPKITTPPGLRLNCRVRRYILSVFLHRIFVFRCSLASLRFTVTFTLVLLPVFLTRLLAFHQRRRPPPLLTPSPEALVLSTFPIAWFYGFLYYTEVPSLVSVLLTVVLATQQWHLYASLLGVLSCLFRQTNIVWVMYAFAISQLMGLRSRRGNIVLHDPHALLAGPGDFLQSITSAPAAIPELLPPFMPYTLVLVLFGAFILWNGGIVLGDKANHVPVLHVPQMYYFIAFATLMGWPAVIFGRSGPVKLANEVACRMFGTKGRIVFTTLLSAFMTFTVHRFTIHHPFLLADNRHYTFYVWRRVFMLHPIVPYLFILGYQACAWAWWLRVASDQTLLQTLVLPLVSIVTLLPTPLLEPRYFLVPYILLRAQVVDMSSVGLFVEGLWYGAMNFTTIYVFLYMERAGVGRFMW